MTKTCRICGIEKEEATFFRPNWIRGFRNDCRECERDARKVYRAENQERLNQYSREYAKRNRKSRNACKRGWYARNKAQHRETVRRRTYGLEPGAFDAMLSAQGGKCAICSSSFGERRACIDHCHSTGRVRGLLCIQCNNILGNSEDSTQRLESAIKYLMRVDEHS